MGKRKTVPVFEKFQCSSEGKYFALTKEMLKSKAFNSLSSNAIRVYFYLLSKYDWDVKDKTFVRTNSDNISFTRDEIIEKRKEGYGLPSNNPSMLAIDELIDKGFLICKKSGYSTRSCNIYAFYHGWQIENYSPKEKHKRLAKRNY